MQYLTPKAYSRMSLEDSDEYDVIFKDKKSYNDEAKEKLVQLYVKSFPISSLKYTGKKFIQKNYVFKGASSFLQQVNKYGETWFDYINKKGETQPPSEYI